MDRPTGWNRREWLAAAVATLLPGALLADDAVVVEVYKSATCGCCSKWLDHLRAHGFRVRAQDVQDLMAARARLGIPHALGSCHSAQVGGYAIEGHVPAPDILRLLRERPDAAGLAVPGMPRGSPGMEVGVNDPYAVLLFQPDGRYTVYRRYPGS